MSLSQPFNHNRRVLIIGTDGMRPDAIDTELMPTYTKLIEKGTLFTKFQSAYPSETRVSMTTLTTGVYPGKHGVVGNLMYIPGFGNDGKLQTGNDKHLLQYENVKGEPFILYPTLGDRLYTYGTHLSVAASSSPGASLLWNLNHPEHVINPSSDYRVPWLTTIHQKYGGVADEEKEGTKLQRALWATRVFIAEQLEDPSNQVMVLWLSEPDSSQHYYGLGSKEAKRALQVVDQCVSKVLQAVERLGISDHLDIFFISDHGHSTVEAKGSLHKHMGIACNELSIENKFVTAGNYIYFKPENPPSQRDIVKLIRWLETQEWCESIFINKKDITELTEYKPIETILGPVTHNRAPQVVVNPKWTDKVNEHGVPGTVQALTDSSTLKSSHGTLAPFDRHAFCLGYGPSFKEGVVISDLSSIVDIAPTVCQLIGLDKDGFDGLVLSEGLKQGVLD